MIRIISTPVFAIHRKKSYIHIDTNPEDLLKKLSMKRTINFDVILRCKYDFGKFLSSLIKNVMKKYLRDTLK